MSDIHYMINDWNMPIMCSASTMHRALIESGLKAGDWVAFPGGGGGVGIQGVLLARYGPSFSDMIQAD